MQFISPKVHSIIGLVVGIALLFAPSIFSFSDLGGAAVWLPRIIGVIVILSELTVRGNFMNQGFVPMKIHVMTDVAMGTLLFASPWLFGFIDQSANGWVPHVVVGIAMVGYALMTQTNEESLTTKHAS